MEKFVETSIAFLILAYSDVSKGEITNTAHITNQAKKPNNNLACYQCDYMLDGEKCTNIRQGDNSSLLHKCPKDQTLCSIIKYSYTTSTENSTSLLKMWSLHRNCTSKCESGCIIIGERTKLYACTTCCSTYACNHGKGGTSTVNEINLLINGFILMISLYYTNLPFS